MSARVIQFSFVQLSIVHADAETSPYLVHLWLSDTDTGFLFLIKETVVGVSSHSIITLLSWYPSGCCEKSYLMDGVKEPPHPMEVSGADGVLFVLHLLCFPSACAYCAGRVVYSAFLSCSGGGCARRVERVWWEWDHVCSVLLCGARRLCHGIPCGTTRYLFFHGIQTDTVNKV